MPLQKITLRPGINLEATPTANTGGWSFSNLIRFFNGFAQKFGGWLKYNITPTVGIARALHAWADLSGYTYLAVGSNSRLQIYSDNIVTDITPIRKTTTTLSNAFSTTSGSNSVKITDTADGAAVGDWVNIEIPVSIGGIVVFGYYLVATIVNANSYTFLAATPATSTVNNGGAVPNFTTTNTSANVTVTLNNHGYLSGQIFNVQVSTSVGGLTLLGQYLITSITDANNFVIGASGTASSSASAFENSGNAIVQYLLPSGPVSDVPLTGWGTGAWGSGSWGMSSGSVSVTPLRNWYLDNFGQNLVAMPTNGTLYQWVPPISAGNATTAVTNAPTKGSTMFVATPQEQVMIGGAETGGTQDFLLVRWCDIGLITVWTATITNQAGSFRLGRGSKIVGSLQGPLMGLWWTDLDLWTSTYQGLPYIYNFQMVGENCGLIAPKAAAILSNTAYWPSLKGFYVYNPSLGVQTLPCTVWDWFFTRVDTNNLDKIFAGSNSLFNEVMFFFPSTDSTNPTAGEIDSYVKLTTVGDLWDYGSLVRFSWIDQSVLGNPLAVDGAKYIQQHEIGNDADGAPMGDFIQSGYVDISDGSYFMLVDWLIPDFIWKTVSSSDTPNVQLTIYTLYSPGDPAPGVFGPFTVTPQTQYITIRTRARQMAIKIQSSAMDTFWRVGAVRYRGAPAGRY